jgi:hypothetical protein
MQTQQPQAQGSPQINFFGARSKNQPVKAGHNIQYSKAPFSQMSPGQQQIKAKLAATQKNKAQSDMYKTGPNFNKKNGEEAVQGPQPFIGFWTPTNNNYFIFNNIT